MLAVATTMPTDAIANELSIRLFLFGLAALSFYEALKLERTRAYVAWAACALFLASGIFLTPLANAWPMGADWLGQLVANPVSWFVLLMGAYLILRTKWVIPPRRGNDISKIVAPYDDTKLRAEFAELKPLVLNIQNRIGIVEERLEKTTRIARLVYDAVHVRDAAAKLTPLLGELDKQLAAPLPPHTHVVSRVKVARNVEAHVLDELGRISPPDREHYESKRDAAVAAVQQNAIYCTVKPGEEANFSSGEDKQSWHIAQARMKALRLWLSDLLTGQFRSRMLGKRDDED